jgi:polyhydroxybutyrate depolymerase
MLGPVQEARPVAGLTNLSRIGFTNQRLGLIAAILSLVACSTPGGPPATSESSGPAATASVTAPPPEPSQTGVSPTPAAGSDVDGSIESGGFKRTYVLHLPPASTRLQPTPLVAAFHGWPMSAVRMADVTHLAAVADAHGFAVLFPQGYGNSWSVPGGLATPAHEAGIDDVAFVRELLDSVGPTYQLDSSRAVATGISNGGHLVEALACSLADHLVGIVPVAAPLRAAGPADCRPSRSVSVLEIVGSDDLDGTAITDTLAFWGATDKCPSSSAESSLPDTVDDGTRATITSFTNCATGTEVTGYLVIGGGHAWPGGRPLGSVEEFGRTSREFDASELIWTFLSSHS